MAPKADAGIKYDKGKIERILALSLELTNYELSQLIQKLTEMSNERIKSIPFLDNIDTIST